MDRSLLRLPDPDVEPPNGERRRSVRQKLHTPVYASFNGPQTGMVVDLSELLDLNEDGFAVQTSERLEMNRAVSLCLDLPETKSYIHGSGKVVWSDDAGRAGIRFSALPESSRQILNEWLFANLLIGCSNHAARTEQLARREEGKSPEPAPVGKARTVVPSSDGNGTLSWLAAVQQEVGKIGDNVDAVFQLITERALTLTGATGAALAFLTDGKMICRARAGRQAPALGALVDVKHGLSGECVRSDLLVSCEDTGNDPRVDPEVCRTLGIGSLMAAPIVSYLRVVGLLEVFSPRPHGFTKTDETVLDRLVEMIPKAYRETIQPRVHEQISQQILEQTVSAQVPEQILEPAPTVWSRWLHLGLFGLAILVVAMVVGYVVTPLVEKRISSQASQPSVTEAASTASEQIAIDLGSSDQRSSVQRSANEHPAGQLSADQRPRAMSLPALRKLADQGDADAQWQMGVRYHNGEDVPQNDTQAVRWFLRAAEQGHVTAQATLGAYYWAGRGVPSDLSKAYFWSALALAQGDENSKSRLEGLASQMTRAQVSDARQQAEAWIHQHNAAQPANTKN